MGKILDDMMRLREDMDRGHAERRAAGQARAEDIAQMASGVMDMLGGFASGRQAQFDKDQAARGAFIGNLVQGVRDLSEEVGVMMTRMHEERMDTAAQDAEVRRQAVSERVEDIRAKLGEFHEEMAAFRDEFAATAEQDARVRLNFVAEKAREVADTLSEFRERHEAETAQDAAARREFMADISSQVRTLQGDVAADLAGIRGLFGGGIRTAKPSPSPARRAAQSQPAHKPAARPKAPAAQARPSGEAPAASKAEAGSPPPQAEMAGAAEEGGGKRAPKQRSKSED